jgi:hypothetical protein
MGLTHTRPAVPTGVFIPNGRTGQLPTTNNKNILWVGTNLQTTISPSHRDPWGREKGGRVGEILREIYKSNCKRKSLSPRPLLPKAGSGAGFGPVRALSLLRADQENGPEPAPDSARGRGITDRRSGLRKHHRDFGFAPIIQIQDAD